MRVSAPDLRRIMRFLDAAYAAESREPYPRSTLTAITDVIAADEADYFEVRPDGVSFLYDRVHEHPADWTDEVVARAAH